ncbi:MAG: hypothetical protein QF406_11790 [Verrucomicrobiota bacterium]|nr:hypothetical protein [Verrucomicrobiota bacterium]
MNKLVPFLMAGLALPVLSANYTVAPNWAKMPTGEKQIGNMHGDVAISSKGDVYVSVQGGPKAGVQVYDNQGNYLRNVPGAPKDFHGFVIRKTRDGEHIYGPRLGGQNILKLTLDGKVVLNIPPSTIPDKYKNKRNNKAFVRLTAMDVAPNGDLFVVDGYSTDYIHHFDKTGKYVKSFGGRKALGSQTLHKICIDTRYNPPRILGADREKLRLIHLSLDGKFLGVYAKDVLRPAAVAVHGDLAVAGEIKGRSTLYDKEGKVFAHLGHNTAPGETATNKLPPAKWRPGFFSAPHGVAFNGAGDLFVAEYTVHGRIHRFNLKK